ncbi:T9SS type B sorting domain-containing protein [Flavobacterium undicola]|uniref:T9SS type B sorting domain-containing protein n=1 Tax=Flavobacterium undicola TaxID=1932779 RepID=UPI00137745E8|nr:T9SS type B sorting domain-containing protein [Flavobacterium undicola]MBA0883039.1 T9SS type B sorting domain-containing protein [Flavobacterium undicola]
MKHKIFILFLLYTTVVFSQQEASVWYFGQNAGMKFNPDGSVTPLGDGKLKTNEGCASIANSNGDLLFYTDGRTVWDRNHVVMPNGDYFNGTGLLGDFSSTQSAIIVPKPGNSNLYYIFTLDEPHHENAAKYPNAFSGNYADIDSGKTPDTDDGLNNGLNYSIVDISTIGSNGSIGDVVSRNNHLITYDTNPLGEEIKYKCSEKLTAVKDASGSGYWVITQFTDNFYAFKVTTSGVNTTPVKSAISPIVPVFGYRRNAIGYLKASPNGKKLAAAYDQIDTPSSPFSLYKGCVYLFDFDASTGSVFNSKLILSDVRAYGIEFSSNSNVLYTSFSATVTNQTLAQFNLLNNDIPNSKVLLSASYYGAGALQLALNKKIYFCTYELNSLGVINNPDVLGLGCNFDKSGQPLATNTSRVLGLPPFITSFFDAFFNAENLCQGESTMFKLTSSETITSATWNFGDGTTSTDINSTHIYASPGTYSVSVTATSAVGTVTKTKDIVISAIPTATKPQNILICDSNNDGFNTFDLTSQNAAILNGQDPNLYAINYFVNNVAIVNPNTYNNTVPYQQENITAEVYNKLNNNCKSTTSFTIDVFDTPKPSTLVSKINLCDNTSVGTDTDGKVIFDLTQRATAILNGQSTTQFILSYYKDVTLTQSISNPTTYQNTNVTETVYVKVANKDNLNCTAVTSFPIEVLALPTINSVVDLKQCDDNTDGFSVFNLEEAIAKITSNAAAETISFHKTIADAQNNVNLIVNRTAYTNQTVSADKVFVRIANSNGCYRIAQLNLIISTTQIPATFSRSFTQCDDVASGSNTDGIAVFDFSSVDNEVRAIFPSGQLLDITYYKNIADALAEKNAIADIAHYSNIGYPNIQSIYIRVDSRLNNDCLGLGSYITLKVETIPIVAPIAPFVHCDDNQDGYYAFDITGLDSQIKNGRNVIVTYFDANNNPLPSPLPNLFVTASQTIKAIITNNSTIAACSYNVSISFVVDDLPEAFPVSTSLTTACDDETDPGQQDGKFAFDTSAFHNIILGNQTGMIVKYFDGSDNALSSPLPNPFVTDTQNVRVEVVNSGNTNCIATTTIPFVVNSIPNISLEGDELVCSNLPTFTKVIDAGIQDASPITDYSYAWSFNDEPITGENNYTLTVNTEGIYTVKVTNNQGCSRLRTITVSASDIAVINNVDIVELSDSNSITVSVSGSGDYVFALDDEFGVYQTENNFTNVSAGIHTVFVKDLNGCGIVPKEVAILGIPNFFTPNQDGHNDTWNIKGVNASFNAKTLIHIFDRYGKLIKQISPTGAGWDGTFNGNPMPASDYWYSVQLENGRFMKGHFALKR